MVRDVPSSISKEKALVKNYISFFIFIASVTFTNIGSMQREESSEAARPENVTARDASEEAALAFLTQCRKAKIARELQQLEDQLQHLTIDEKFDRQDMELTYEQRIQRKATEGAENISREQLKERMQQEEHLAKNRTAQRRFREEEQVKRQMLIEEEQRTHDILYPLIQDFLKNLRELEAQKKAFQALEETSIETKATLTRQVSMHAAKVELAENEALQAEKKAQQALEMFERMQKTHRAISYTAQAIWQIYDKAPKALAILGFAASISPEDYLINMIGDSARTIRQMSAYVGAMIATVDFLIKNHKTIRTHLIKLKDRMSIIKKSMDESYEKMLPLRSQIKQRAGRFAQSVAQVAKRSIRTLGKMQNAMAGISDSESDDDEK